MRKILLERLLIERSVNILRNVERETNRSRGPVHIGHLRNYRRRQKPYSSTICTIVLLGEYRKLLLSITRRIITTEIYLLEKTFPLMGDDFVTLSHERAGPRVTCLLDCKAY